MITDKQVEAAINEFIGVSHEGYFPSREQMRCVLEAAEAAAWQDIATAPKDGTLVLVYAALNPPEKWDECVQDLEPFIGHCAYHPDGGWCVCTMREVTHWRPLPQPPKETT